jgi:hypothetical protein
LVHRLAFARAAFVACVSLGILACVVSPLAACNGDTELGTLDASVDSGGEPESAPDAASNGTGITVTSLAPALTSAPGEKASATWAAFQLDDGEWRPLGPAPEGTYTFSVPVARWAIALVCASNDGSVSTVSVHRRTAATRALEVSLETQCTPDPPPAEFVLAGTISNLPPTTTWLDFGYARDTRGMVLSVASGQGSYEVVGVAPGTWDLGFGIRDDSFGMLTRIFLLRGTILSADRTLDIDATGPASFAPASRRLLVRGVEAGDTVTPRVLYAAGGPHGIDVGPQDVPVDMNDVLLTYATVPDAMQLPGDRYHATITAERDRRVTLRSIELDVHQAVDLDVSFLPVAPKPTVVVRAKAPQVRLETRFPVLASAVRHEVRVRAEVNRRTPRVWLATFDAASVAGSVEVVDAMPDLAALPGWRSDWGLPVGVNATVTATSYEAPQAIGDGMGQRASGNSATITP